MSSFRIIRQPEPAEGQKESFRRRALLEEMVRWMHLTRNSGKACHEFVDHYEEVRQKHRDETGLMMMENLQDKIRGKHPGLESVQGNLNLACIDDLLTGLDDFRKGRKHLPS